ncbi:MAG: hypothetical protein HZY75_13205 [Nocardioidaceae bacterium]|nr:MAG: hypothetical protein HZY75_13205 [Nocardioidaceae bacterium]
MSEPTPAQAVTEGGARIKIADAIKANDFRGAALMALALAEMVGVRSAEGAAVYMAQAQVFATLHQAEMALFIAENRQPIHPGGWS